MNRHPLRLLVMLVVLFAATGWSSAETRRDTELRYAGDLSLASSLSLIHQNSVAGGNGHAAGIGSLATGTHLHMATPSPNAGVTVIPEGELVIDWTMPLEDERHGLDSVKLSGVIVEETIVFGDALGGVWALDVRSGRQIWRTESLLGGAQQVHTVLDDIIVVGGGDRGSAIRELYALDLASGRRLWSFETEGFFRFGAGRGNLIYLATSADTIRALDLFTGLEKWRRPFPKRLGSLRGTAIGEDTLCIAQAEDGTVFCLDATNGQERWTLDVEPPALVGPNQDEVIYVGSGDGYVFALEASNGRERWRTQVPTPAPDVFWPRVDVIDDGLVFGSGKPPGYFALDSSTGEVDWSAVGSAGVYSAILQVHDGIVVGAVDGNVLVALDAGSGEQLWRRERTGRSASVSSWVFVEDSMYLGGNDGSVTEYNLLTGTARSTVKVAQGPVNLLGVGYGRLIGRSEDHLFAIGGTEGPEAIPTIGSTLAIHVDTTLLGAPASSAVEIVDLAAGTEVRLLDLADAVDGHQWWYVRVEETGATGFLPELTLRPWPTQDAPPISPSPPAAAATDIDVAALMPTTADLPVQGLSLTSSGERTLSQVAATFGSAEAAAEAEQYLRELGWSRNAFTDFAGDPTQLAPDATTVLTVSVHEFADQTSASAALVYFSDIVVEVQAFSEGHADPIGDEIRLLRGVSENGTTSVAAYIVDGKLLYRIGGSSPAGDPTGHVLQLASSLIDDR